MFNRLKLIFFAAIKIHEKGKKKYFHRLFFCFAIISHWRQASLLLSNVAPLSLSLTLQRRPESLGVLVWPYINNMWTCRERVDVICQHHKIISEESSIAIEVGESIVVMNMHEIFDGLSVVIDRPKWFMREGELSLNLFIKEERVYSLAFTLAMDGERRVAYIGGVQGRNIPEILALYHEFTKAMYGCRPRDFLIHVFTAFCKQFSVNTIYAVAEAHRHHRHSYFGTLHKSSNSSNYDEIWSERGGLLGSSGFYSLEVNADRRSIEEIPAKKRSMYKKRYELFEKVRVQLRERFQN